jgi:hypothetical protein
MKRLEIEEGAYTQFETYRGEDDQSKTLRQLVRLGKRQREEQDERIALVILEGVWDDFDDNPGQRSNAPFLEGVCRSVDSIRSYRLNFYDAASFAAALEKAVTVPEKRILLYIGAHGSKTRLGSANATNLMKKVAEFSRDKRKIEGIILSSCLVAGHDPALIASLKGGTHWIFGYTSSVDFLGSIRLETAILEQVWLAQHDYAQDEDKIVEVFAKALGSFNPVWKIGGDGTVPLWQSVRLVTRGKHMKTAAEYTDELLDQAWPDIGFRPAAGKRAATPD